MTSRPGDARNGGRSANPLDAGNTVWFPLRRNLLVSLIGGLTVLWLLTLTWSYVDAHHEIDEIFDAHLAQAARQALEQYRHGNDKRDDRQDRAQNRGDDDEGTDSDEDGRSRVAHEYQQNIAFQIWHRDGRLLIRSPNAPTNPLTGVDGFSESDTGDGHWRYYSEWSKNGKLRVVAGESHGSRDELIGKIAIRLALPLLIGLPLSAMWIGLALSRGVAPLAMVAGEIGRRGPEQLDAVTPARAPQEIRPMLESLNALLARLASALDGERRFTADAAHELRTPLAGLRAQAQVALRATDEVTRRRALEQVLVGSGRAAHLIDQLLTLARLDPARPRQLAAQADLAAVASEVCAALGAAALAKNIALSLDATGNHAAMVRCDGEWLRILVRNLVDNALRYSPGGGCVRVEIAADAGSVNLTVEDDGPGIPTEQRGTVFERFRRLAGQDIEGSGLGLSIVARIAEQAGATIALDAGESGRGLKVRVKFPAPAPV